MENYFYFFNKHWILTLEFIVIIILFLFNELYISRNLKSFISIEAAVDLINHKNAKIFDIRKHSDVNEGHIKNSFNINVSDLTDNKYMR